MPWEVDVMMSLISRAEEFVKKSYQENPAYSFGDWRIMYDHSVMVKDFALLIAESVECDKDLLGVEAVLHDIGKTYKADPETLRVRHAELGFEVSKDFIADLQLSQLQIDALARFLKGELESIEARIVKDADIIAFFADEHLQNAFKSWADSQKLSDELQRKADKVNKLVFPTSKITAEPLYTAMIERWHLSRLEKND